MFDWTISALDTIPHSPQGADLVQTVHWRCTGTDGPHTADVYSTCTLEPGDTFIPFKDLTKQTVLDWIWAHGVDKTVVEQAVQARLEELKNPPIVSKPLPWA